MKKPAPKGFFRKEVIEPALDEETERHILEQQAAIEADTVAAKPHHNLGALYRLQGKTAQAEEEFRKALSLDPTSAESHIALGQMCVVREDYQAAWLHAKEAAKLGDPQLLKLLERYPGVTRPTP
ncbi:MAG: tetratricopeptide repeat protein [Acidobacteria bacterium]|nr:tetratricopeptide repeat protein [Acidobacteriota bacterium]